MTRSTSSTPPNRMSGLSATTHQRSGTRTRTMLANSGRSFPVPAATSSAATIGPSNAGKCVGQPSPVSTTRPPKAIGSSQAQLSP